MPLTDISESSELSLTVPQNGGGRPRVACRLRTVCPDIIGVFGVNGVAVVFMIPAIVRGIYPGSTWDQITELVPWSTVTWSQVHHGHLPLWNPYSALGMPLAFNWQSAPLSLTSVVGYFLPVQWAYTTSVLLSVMIAGTGAYVFGRVIRLGVLGSVMAAIVFELSGPIVLVLGWPIATVSAWFGWLLAGIVLVLRGGRRARHVAFLAIVIAQTVYAGQLDMLGIVALAALVFVLALFAVRVARGGLREQLRPAGDLVVATIAGAALSAPLLLPGLQLAQKSIHTTNIRSGALKPGIILSIIFPAFIPFPVYIGLIAVAMALVAIVVRWRREEVSALALMSLILGGLAFVPVATTWVEELPGGTSALWFRVVVPMGFGLAMLAGVGVDLLVRRPSSRLVVKTTAVVFAGAVLMLALLGILTTPSSRSVLRTHSFLWTSISAMLGLLVAGCLWSRLGSRRKRRVGQTRRRIRAWPSVVAGRFGRGWWAAVLMIACEATFLIVAGRPSVAPRPPIGVTGTDMALAKKAGSAIVGFGANQCFNQLNTTPELNDELGVHEFSAYDPILPRSYFTEWNAMAGTSAGPNQYLEPKTVFCPAITSATIARLFGVSLVVTAHGAPGPSGSDYAGTLGKVDLYRIPGAAVATVSPLGPDGSLPPAAVPEHPVSATQPYPGAWKVTTNTRTPQALRLRITDVPGWHATIDGRPLPLESFAGVMLQARLPPGDHTILLTYWPTAFTVGLWLAGAGAVGIIAMLVVEARRHRRRSIPST